MTVVKSMQYTLMYTESQNSFYKFGILISPNNLCYAQKEKSYEELVRNGK